MKAIQSKSGKTTARSSRSWRYRIIPYLYVLPLVIISGAFIYYCMGFTIAMSFTDWDGISMDASFIGLKNYTKLLTPGSIFFQALLNNLIFLVVTVVVQAALGLLLAVILKERMPGSNLFKAFFFMPVTMAAVIIAAVFRGVLDPNLGGFNQVLADIGLGGLAHSWFGDPKTALLTICVVNIFQWTGFSMIIYYAGLMSIPQEVYEAAKIDGAGFWKTLFYVTLPMLRGTTNVLIVLGIVGSLKTFDIVMQTTGGGPGRATEFLNTYLYKVGIQQYEGGLSSAIGVLVLIIAILMSLGQMWLSNREK
ncbi:ABC-type sugar transport system, permease component [Bifidobacterium ramosum]|uniref:ABC transporter permease subunit n=1 Tax=Bifidobacterium ramosum TaxID=1798158 RepID=A0A6L4X169_9BIFI|nr:sugar ABC transporter permease [Bifidobacterium ramosum]KAB8288400.1 ABC-type sugar transport system, permease component [Bifidobacterium ramosum]NEG71565.1 ABC transporter permease subunit [Bifidobacterium ramosum]